MRADRRHPQDAVDRITLWPRFKSTWQKASATFSSLFSLSLSLSLSLPLFLYELTAFNELTATPSELLVTLDLMRLKSGLRLSLVSPYLIAG